MTASFSPQRLTTAASVFTTATQGGPSLLSTRAVSHVERDPHESEPPLELLFWLVFYPFTTGIFIAQPKEYKTLNLIITIVVKI